MNDKPALLASIIVITLTALAVYGTTFDDPFHFDDHSYIVGNDEIRSLLALRINPGDAGVHFNLGLAYASIGRIEEARREFEAVLRINPGDAGARKMLDSL